MENLDFGGSQDATKYHVRRGRIGKVKAISKKAVAISLDKQTSKGTLQRGGTKRPRPQTSGGIVRQLIIQTENQLAQKRSDLVFIEGQIQFLEKQIHEFRQILTEWEAGVSAIESNQEEKE